jgi:hypothetical protein
MHTGELSNTCCDDRLRSSGCGWLTFFNGFVSHFDSIPTYQSVQPHGGCQYGRYTDATESAVSISITFIFGLPLRRRTGPSACRRMPGASPRRRRRRSPKPDDVPFVRSPGQVVGRTDGRTEPAWTHFRRWLGNSVAVSFR